MRVSTIRVQAPGVNVSATTPGAGDAHKRAGFAVIRAHSLDRCGLRPVWFTVPTGDKSAKRQGGMQFGSVWYRFLKAAHAPMGPTRLKFFALP
jgi:(2Fe-2S) ferredoxin